KPAEDGQKTDGDAQKPAGDRLKASQAALSDAFKQLLEEQLKNPISDSPFDQLDRVSDFYAGYILKQLRLRGDARAVDAKALFNFLQKDDNDPEMKDVTPPSEQDSHKLARVIVLYIQSHVHPGTL